jgi:holo-[acyl-carrier protein] synthase
MTGRETYGVGIDLVSVDRIEQVIKRWGRRFLERVFTKGEIEYCSGRPAPARSLAARFAAKEAFIKSVSGRPAAGIRYRDVEVVIDGAGVPRIKTHGTARAAAGLSSVSVSLSHEENLAVAIVLRSPEVKS